MNAQLVKIDTRSMFSVYGIAFALWYYLYCALPGHGNTFITILVTLMLREMVAYLLRKK